MNGQNERENHKAISHESFHSQLSVHKFGPKISNKKALCWNGLIWSFGNTFVSTTLLIYILFGLVGKSDYSWIFLTTAILSASPRLVGTFRLFAPKFLGRQSNLSRKVALFYGLSGASLCFIPLIMLCQNILPIGWIITGLIVFWTIHHLNEYIGDIAVDCMVGELIPENSRGNYYASRGRYMLIGTISASAIAFLLKDCSLPIDHHLFWSWVGAGFIILSIVPLLLCSPQCCVHRRNIASLSIVAEQSVSSQNRLEILFSPLRHSVFGVFLIYGIMFSFINGLTQTAQYEYCVHGLGISFEFYLILTALCRIGQWGINWIVGPWSDKAIRQTLMSSQCVVAFSLLFLSIASTEFYYVPIYLSWLCLSGYSGLNVGVPKYLQTLSQVTGNRPANFALYNAVSGLAFAVSVILSGLLLDMLGFIIDLKSYTIFDIPFFAFMLIIGFLLRLLLVPILRIVVKPNPNL